MPLLSNTHAREHASCKASLLYTLTSCDVITNAKVSNLLFEISEYIKPSGWVCLELGLKRATQGTSIRITGAAELELRPNPEERDVSNPEHEAPENGTGHLQASPAGSKGHSLPSTAGLLYIQVLQSTYIHTTA